MLGQHLAETTSTLSAEHLYRLRSTVDRLMEMAAWNSCTNAHERQWGGSTVNPLLNEISLWPGREDVRLYNM